MRLPNLERLDVPRSKIVEYLLNLSHPIGRGKAIFFMRFGFTLQQWEVLADALKHHAHAYDVVRTELSPFGMRYVMEGQIQSP